MARNKRKSKKHYGHYVSLGVGMLRGQEWKGLSPAAKLLYIHLKSKYNGSNNGQIRLYYTELRGIKGLASSSTISKAFQELEIKSWIERTRLGGLRRYVNEYKLTGKYDQCLQ